MLFFSAKFGDVSKYDQLNGLARRDLVIISVLSTTPKGVGG